MRIILFLLICLLFVSGISNASSISPEDLRIEYLRNPAGLDVERPRFGWTLTATNKQSFNQRQTAYRIMVATSPVLLRKGKTDQWDSGWVTSNQTQHRLYEGSPLQADRRYYWKVQVKDETGKISEWSAPAEWSTGLFSQQEWKAKWIGSDELYDKKAKSNNVQDPWFRKTVNLLEKPGKATIFIASVGYHELYVNGEKIGEEVLAPAATDHTRRARYVAYEIAGKLRKGENVIGIWLGTSWAIFPPYILHEDRPLTPIVKAQVSIYKEQFPSPGDKPSLEVLTDASWKTHPSSNKLTGKWDFRQMGGEIWDDRNFIANWSSPGLNENQWKPATEYATKLQMSAQRVEGNRLFGEIKPVKVEKREDGSFRVDMGTNFAGWTEVKVKGNEGDTVRFQYSESEKHDMTFNLYSAFVIGKSGKGVFRNKFNYSSGRWITITGLKNSPAPEDIKGWMVRTDFKTATDFQCSDPLQNWIYDRTLWTFQNLSLGGYIVDCPQRERMGYGGDAHATSETGMFNYDLAAFYAKWMEDWQDVQGTEPMVGNMLDPAHARKAMTSGRIFGNGSLPHTAPTYWGGGGPAWGGIVVTLPWFMYQHYGDDQVLQANYDVIKKWLTFLDSHTENHLLKRFGGQWDFLGDWLWPNANAEGMNNDKPETLFLNNAYYVFNLRTAAQIAAVLGDKQQAETWKTQARISAKAIHEKFYNSNNNSYSDGSMANLAAALLAEIPSPELRPFVLKSLEKEILETRKGHIHAGITGGALLFKLLREENRNDLIYTMLSKTEYPGWGYMKENGATTIWEAWEKDLPGHSLLHSSYLYPGAWYIDGLVGIKRNPEHPGFSEFIISPPAKEATNVKWAKASYHSPSGTIKFHWSREDGNLKLNVAVPPNTIANLILTEDETPDISRYPSISVTGKENGIIRYSLKPGNYQLTAQRN